MYETCSFKRVMYAAGVSSQHRLGVDLAKRTRVQAIAVSCNGVLVVRFCRLMVG